MSIPQQVNTQNNNQPAMQYQNPAYYGNVQQQQVYPGAYAVGTQGRVFVVYNQQQLQGNTNGVMIMNVPNNQNNVSNPNNQDNRIPNNNIVNNNNSGATPQNNDSNQMPHGNASGITPQQERELAIYYLKGKYDYGNGYILKSFCCCTCYLIVYVIGFVILDFINLIVTGIGMGDELGKNDKCKSDFKNIGKSSFGLAFVNFLFDAARIAMKFMKNLEVYGIDKRRIKILVWGDGCCSVCVLHRYNGYGFCSKGIN